MKRLRLFLCITSLLIRPVAAVPIVVNGDFSAFGAGWTTGGTVVFNGFDGRALGGGVAVPQVETDLGLVPGTILAARPGSTGAGFLFQAIGSALDPVLAGSTLSFTWIFDEFDSPPNTDYGFVSFTGTGTNDFIVLRDVSQGSGSGSFVYTVPNTSPLVIGFGAFNVSDNFVPPALRVDNVNLSAPQVPEFDCESASLPLLFTAMLVLAAYRRPAPNPPHPSNP